MVKTLYWPAVSLGTFEDQVYREVCSAHALNQSGTTVTAMASGMGASRDDIRRALTSLDLQGRVVLVGSRWRPTR